MKIKVITYNIDGLPYQLDLNDLPWILKPVAWIYKLFKKTTLVTINDNSDIESKIKTIGDYLNNSDADIIAVQEDFNYHDVLCQCLNKLYKCGWHAGGFNLKDLWKSTEWLSCFPLPRFKADGLNIFVKNNIRLHNENIVKWNKSYGYFSHANDKLTHKGFRHYETIIGDVTLNIIILHMDADFLTVDNFSEESKDYKIRTKQLDQLAEYILNCTTNYPTVIMGDTNCYSNRELDNKAIQEHLFNPINTALHLDISEVGHGSPDRIFIINDITSNHEIKETKSCSDISCNGLSDHLPFVTELELVVNNK